MIEEPPMQDIIQMCSFDASKSTKGASKLRRDLINTEIGHLRDLLPLPASTRQRLSQLQLMALICVYVRKANYFQQVFKRHDLLGQMPTPSIGFSKAMNGFLMMMTQNGKLLYISDNAAEYLGHSMEDLLIHGDSVYDIIDKQDHQAVQSEMSRPPAAGAASAVPGPSAVGDDSRLFLCRMNVSRNARRQMRFGDQKVILVEGHFVSYLPLCTRNEPVLIATCTPVAMPETRECVVQGATNIFTSIHNMDMKFASVDKNAEFYLGYSRQELMNVSWYQLLHWDFMREAQAKHRLITQSEQDRSCILLIRLQRRNGDWLWIHCVLQVRDATDAGQQPVIVCTNQVLSEREAHVMRANSWLYHYYLVQSKLQYGLNYEQQQQPQQQQQQPPQQPQQQSKSPYYPPLMSSPSSNAHGSLCPPAESIPAHPAPFHQPLTSPPYPLHYGHVMDSSAYHFQGGTTPSGNSYHHHPHPHQYGLSGFHTGHYEDPGHQRPLHVKAETITADTPSVHDYGADHSRTHLGGYHIKIETKSGEFQSPDPVKEEADADSGESANQPAEDSNSAPSPPLRKRPRTSALAHHLTANSFTPADHPPPQHPQAAPSSLDWHRSRTDHAPSHSYTQVWANGWINTSYPAGITQLEHGGDRSFDESFGRHGNQAFGLLVGASHVVQPQRLFKHKTSVEFHPLSDSGRYMESVQRVPDVTAVVPDLSPSGYVLTPAPTPPDSMKEVKSGHFFTMEGLPPSAQVFLTEQCVPVAPGSETEFLPSNPQDAISSLLAAATPNQRLYLINSATSAGSVPENATRDPLDPSAQPLHSPDGSPQT